MKDNMRNEYELAVIMKKVIFPNDTIGYVPEKVVEGYYDDSVNCFVDFDGTLYLHVITDPLNYGFCNRKKIGDLKKEHPKLPINLIKRIILHMFKKYSYVCENEVDTELKAPVISVVGKNSTFDLKDDDILNFYKAKYLDYYNFLTGEENEEVLEEENAEFLDINALLEDLQVSVGVSEDALKEILYAVLKHYDGVSDKNSFMLLNGSNEVKKVFDIISQKLNIPVTSITFNQYDSIEYIEQALGKVILDMVNDCDCNYDIVEKGIVIINAFDKLVSNYNSLSKTYQTKLVDLLDNGFKIREEDQLYKLDLGNLLIIGLGSWDKFLNVGFSIEENRDFNKEFVKKYGMINPLLDKFKYIIDANNEGLDYSIIIRNKLYIEDLGVKLTIKDDFLGEVSKIPSNNIDYMIEKALSIATMNILTNPDIYSELIIDKETLKDNKKYILVKKND